MLVHSLARQLAKLEIREAREGKVLYQKKKNRLENQLEEAKALRKGIMKKHSVVLDYIEESLGNETKVEFHNLVEKRVKLLITSKEIEEKVLLLNNCLSI